MFGKEIKQDYKRKDYKFNEIYDKQISLEANTQDGFRLYRTPDGNKYPSVTTVLGATKSEASKKSLEEWRKREGEEKAAAILKQAATRGTFLHDSCEDWVKGKHVPIAEQIRKDNNYHLWRQIYPFLNRIDNIMLCESDLYSHKLKIAGRTDKIAEFDGEPSVIDYKTSRSEKEDWMIEDYFIQEAVYGLMFEDLYGIKITQGVILMAVDNNPWGKGLIFKKKLLPYKKKAILRIRQFYNERSK